MATPMLCAPVLGNTAGPQSGCGQSSRIAGKQERSSSQVTLELSPDLEVGGALRPAGRGAGETPIRLRMLRRDYSSMMFGAACEGIVCVHLGLEGWKLLPAASSRG